MKNFHVNPGGFATQGISALFSACIVLACAGVAHAELIVELDRVIRPASIFDGSETIPGGADLKDGFGSLAFDAQSGQLFIGGEDIGGLDPTTDMPISGFSFFGRATALAIHPVTGEFYVYSFLGFSDDIEDLTAFAQVLSPEGDRLRIIDPGFRFPSAATFSPDGELFLFTGRLGYPVDLATGALGQPNSVSISAFPELEHRDFGGYDFDPPTGNLVVVAGGASPLLAEIDPVTWTVISVSAPLEIGRGTPRALEFNADGSQMYLGTTGESGKDHNIYVYNRVPEPTSFLLAILGLSATLAPFRRPRR